MRKRSKGFALARNTGSPLKMSGVIAQPARPRSTASELYTSQPCLTKKFNQPSRPSGVVSYVTPVSPPPCHIKSGTAPRRFADRKYCTYIASTEYVPLRSTFAGTPPGVKTTSLTGLPVISTSRPPTWNEPISASTIGGSCAAASAVPASSAAPAAMPVPRRRRLVVLLAVIDSSPLRCGACDEASTFASSTRCCPVWSPATSLCPGRPAGGSQRTSARMDPLVIYVILGACAAGFVQGLSGFAFGLIAMAFWVSSVPPQLAAPMVVFGSLVGQILALGSLRRGFSLRRALPFILGGVLGVPAGAALLPHIDQTVFKAV